MARRQLTAPFRPILTALIGAFLLTAACGGPVTVEAGAWSCAPHSTCVPAPDYPATEVRCTCERDGRSIQSLVDLTPQQCADQAEEWCQ